jgi:hypothetical protein
MGYNTVLKGSFSIDKPLKPEHKEIFEHIYKKAHNSNIMPSKFCQWKIDSEGQNISWDGIEKFYHFEKWIAFIVTILEPMGYKINGKVFWIAENKGDVGTIKIKDNSIKIWSSVLNAERRIMKAEVFESNFIFN